MGAASGTGSFPSLRSSEMRCAFGIFWFCIFQKISGVWEFFFFLLLIEVLLKGNPARLDGVPVEWWWWAMSPLAAIYCPYDMGWMGDGDIGDVMVFCTIFIGFL